MQNQEQACNCLIEVDRMINEGLGNGSIIKRYAEAHAKLRERQETLISMEYREENDAIY